MTPVSSDGSVDDSSVRTRLRNYTATLIIRDVPHDAAGLKRCQEYERPIVKLTLRFAPHALSRARNTVQVPGVRFSLYANRDARSA
jgi:hypothetical protein